MNVYCVDDSPMQLGNIQEAIRIACHDRELIFTTCNNGQELLDIIDDCPPDLITLDINMPKLDGLSTLVRLRHRAFNCKIIMVSAENEKVIKRLAKVHHFTGEESKRHEMLDRVVHRVKQGVQVDGKINSVLEACGSLGLDPIDIARRLGANAFLQKPFDADDAAVRLRKLLSGATVT